MKNMRKRIALLLLLSLVVGILASCGGTTSKPLGDEPGAFGSFYNTLLSDKGGDGYTKLEKISLPSDTTGVTADGGFFYCKSEGRDKYYVYSAQKGDFILTLPASDTSIELYDEYVCIQTDTKEGTLTEVYGSDGALLASASGHHTISVSDEGFTLDDKLYRMKDGALIKTYTIPPFLSTVSFTFVGNYVIRDNGYRTVYYNENFEAVAYYEVPGEAEEYTTFVLANGNLLVQYCVLCDPMSRGYDYMDASDGAANKYTLHTVLYDPVKNEAKKLKINVPIGMVYNAYSSFPVGDDFDFEEIFTPKVQNVLAYVMFKDGKVDYSRVYCVSLSNNGEIGERLDSFLIDQTGLIYPLANGTYTVSTKTGYAILDKSGNVQKRLVTLGTPTGYGYMANAKIYSADMKLVVDLSQASNPSSCDNAVSYSKTADGAQKYYIYSKYGEKEIRAPKGNVLSGVEVADFYYTVSYYDEDSYGFSSDIRNDVYAYDGTLLLSYCVDYSYSFYGFSVVSMSEDAAIVKYLDADTKRVTFARLSK